MRPMEGDLPRSPSPGLKPLSPIEGERPRSPPPPKLGLLPLSPIGDRPLSLSGVRVLARAISSVMESKAGVCQPGVFTPSLISGECERSLVVRGVRGVSMSPGVWRPVWGVRARSDRAPGV